MECECFSPSANIVNQCVIYVVNHSEIALAMMPTLDTSVAGGRRSASTSRSIGSRLSRKPGFKAAGRRIADLRSHSMRFGPAELVRYSLSICLSESSALSLDPPTDVWCCC